MFAPQFHGTTFTVSYSNDPTMKTSTRAHLIASRDTCDLIALDWKSSLLTIPAGEVVSIESKKNLAVLTLKPTSKFPVIYFNTKPDPLEPLISALTTIVSLPRAETHFLALTAVVPSFKLAEKTQSFHKAVMAQTAQFLQAFCSSAGSIAVNPAFVDVFSCAFRMRFKNEAVQPVATTVPALGLEVRRRLIAAWCEGILACLRPTDTASGKVFLGQLAANAAKTVAKAAKPLGLAVDDLTQAAQASVAPELDAAARRVQKEVREATARELAKAEPFDSENLELLFNVAITIFSGIAAGMYQADVDALAARAVEFTQASVDKNQPAEAKKALLQTQSVFLKDFACLLDGQRYDEPYQFVFCTWAFKPQD
jgi:hypothetical protein